MIESCDSLYIQIIHIISQEDDSSTYTATIKYQTLHLCAHTHTHTNCYNTIHPTERKYTVDGSTVDSG